MWAKLKKKKGHKLLISETKEGDIAIDPMKFKGENYTLENFLKDTICQNSHKKKQTQRISLCILNK